MDTTQIAQELKQLRSDIEQRKERIERYEKFGVRPEESPFAYVFDFKYGEVANVDAEVQLPLQQKVVQIKKDTIFFVKSITQAFTVVGTTGFPAQSAVITLPRTVMFSIFGYRFKIHDTGSDREWQNDWVNGAMLLSGNYNGFRLRRGHALCSPGSEVTIQVDAKSFGNVAGVTRLATVKSQQLQIVLSGFEVPFKKGAV